jgi:26S proteasome regulatory subunit N12
VTSWRVPERRLSACVYTLQIEMHSNLFVKHPVTLEQYLMEGSYNKVIAAQHSPPADSYQYFMSILIVTVRDEIADCCERAYQTLSLADAQSMLMCDSEAELMVRFELSGQSSPLAFRRVWLILGDSVAQEFVGERDEWTVAGGNVTFSQGSLDAKDSVPEVPSNKLIMRTLEYAKELERIV